MKRGEIVVGRVHTLSAAGANVDIGCDAFLPVAETPVDVARLLGQKHHFEILDVPIDGPIVVRHFRMPLSIQCTAAGVEHISQRQPVDKFYVGQRCIGIVRNIAPFGVFIDLGKMDALLRFNDRDVDADDFAIDQVVAVLIQHLDLENEKVTVILAE